ncbi:MAG: LON peptidase substrate-binding domain-containing protein, partial [Candidatus Zixiibacteriota bacterium]
MVDVLDEKQQEQATRTYTLPILPVKGTVVFPYLVAPLMIQDAEQTRLVDDALMRGSRIGLFLQRNPKKKSPSPDDLYHVGCSGNILKMLRFPDGTVRFLIQGLARIRIVRFTSGPPAMMAEVEEMEDIVRETVKLEALQRNVLEQVKTMSELAPYLTEEFHISAINQDTPSKLADFVASNINISIELKQELLEELDVHKRINKLFAALNREVEVLQLSQKIQAQAASELGKSQRDYILREQMKAIKKELGDLDETSELEEFEKKIKAAKMPDYAEQAARKELERLSHMNPSAA